MKNTNFNKRKIYYKFFFCWTFPNIPKIEDISQNVSSCENQNRVIPVAITRFLFLQSGTLWLIYSFYGVLGEVHSIRDYRVNK